MKKWLSYQRINIPNILRKVKFKKELSKKKQQRLLDDLHRLSKAGLDKMQIVEQMRKFGNRNHKEIGRVVYLSLDSGGTFADGLKPWITSLAWEALAANEATGHLTKGLEYAKLAVETQNAATTQLLKSLFVPVLGLVFLIELSSKYVNYFLPLIEPIMPKYRWGEFTLFSQRFCELADVLARPLGLLIALIFVASFTSMPFLTGHLRARLDPLPGFRQYRLIQVSSLLRSLSHLSYAGFGIQESLIQLDRNANAYLSYHIAMMLERVEAGKDNLGKIMDTGLLNQSEIYSMKILGQIGENAETLKTSADIHQDLLMSEINLIKNYGGDFLKIIAAIIGFTILGGIGQILLSMPSVLFRH